MKTVDQNALTVAQRAWLKRCRRKAFKHALEAPFVWLAIALGLGVIVPLPHRVMLALCDALSVVFYRFDRRGRRRALETLRILRNACRGDEGTPRFDPDVSPYDATPREDLIVRRSYRNMSRTVGHIFWTLCFARARVRRVGEMSPAGVAFLRANKPAITVSGHIGCWEILSQLALLEGHRMMSVAKRIGTKSMTKMLMRARRSIGQEIVEAEGAFKALMGGLKSGHSLGLLVDQSVDPNTQGGVWVRFLGRPFAASVAPAFFAAKGKAPIVTAWSRPLKDGRYRCEIIATYRAEEARDIWAMTQRCAHDIERVVRRHPSCWVLNYNFFSNIPQADALATLAQREKDHA